MHQTLNMNTQQLALTAQQLALTAQAETNKRGQEVKEKLEKLLALLLKLNGPIISRVFPKLGFIIGSVQELILLVQALIRNVKQREIEIQSLSQALTPTPINTLKITASSATLANLKPSDKNDKRTPRHNRKPDTKK